jgi:hypothetical protein
MPTARIPPRPMWRRDPQVLAACWSKPWLTPGRRLIDPGAFSPVRAEWFRRRNTR